MFLSLCVFISIQNIDWSIPLSQLDEFLDHDLLTEVWQFIEFRSSAKLCTLQYLVA